VVPGQTLPEVLAGRQRDRELLGELVLAGQERAGRVLAALDAPLQLLDQPGGVRLLARAMARARLALRAVMAR
jgi:hypothetical protein